MDWRDEAIEELKQYPILKKTLVSIPERIQALEAKLQGVRGATLSFAPSRGSGRTNEDRIVEGIYTLDELRETYTLTEMQLELIDRVLGRLSESERRVIEGFYIHPVKGNVGRLIEELGYEQTAIYKIRDEALEKYTSCMFGAAV